MREQINKATFKIGMVDYSETGVNNNLVTIEMELKRNDKKELCFSASGNIWNRSHTDIMSGGQNLDEIGKFFPRNKRVQRIVKLWKAWHLNDMQAGCEHQRANWDTDNKLTIETYTLKTDIWIKQRDLKDKLMEELKVKKAVAITDSQCALLSAENIDIKIEKGEKAPSKKYYELKDTEEKDAHWASYPEFKNGLLSKPCEVCGYKYGTEWKTAQIPTEAVKEINSIINSINKDEE